MIILMQLAFTLVASRSQLIQSCVRSVGTKASESAGGSWLVAQSYCYTLHCLHFTVHTNANYCLALIGSTLRDYMGASDVSDNQSNGWSTQVLQSWLNHVVRSHDDKKNN